MNHKPNKRDWIKKAKPMSVIQARPMHIVLADTKLGKLMASADYNESEAKK